MDLKAVRLSISLDKEDRISKLPDEILIYILSYLTTEDSVCTRILSKRWKYLFTFVPVLRFFGPENYHNPAINGSFLNFVNFVLNSYNLDHMDTFLYISFPKLPRPESTRLISWIQNIVNRRVRVLYVRVNFKTPQTLPKNVLTSKTLTVLKLKGNFHIEVPDNMGLPRLKTLGLAAYFDNELVRRLIRVCPVLEDLFLTNYAEQNSKVFDICSPSLLRLWIHESKLVLVLDVPNLRYMEYDGGKLLGICVRGELKSLVNASIRVPHYSPGHFGPSSKLVSVVSHVQTICLCTRTLQAFQESSLPLPTFHYLTHLEMRLSGSIAFGIGPLIDLLDRTPHLDFLGLDNGFADVYKPVNASELERVPMCVSMHLKVIEIRGLSSMFKERMLVEYFLKNAKVLNRLYIRFGTIFEKRDTMKSRLQKRSRISKELLTLPRCSRAYQVILYSVAEGDKGVILLVHVSQCSRI